MWLFKGRVFCGFESTFIKMKYKYTNRISFFLPFYLLPSTFYFFLQQILFDFFKPTSLLMTGSIKRKRPTQFSLSLFFFFAISSVNLVLYSSVVFNFYTFRDFPDFLLFWFLTILLGLENILYVFQFLKRHFISSILSMLVNVSGALGNNVYSILLDGVLSVCKLGQVG